MQTPHQLSSAFANSAICGWPRRVHDARVFANSDFFHKVENDTLFPKWTKKIVIRIPTLYVQVVIM
jgi:hypothetical protein